MLFLTPRGRRPSAIPPVPSARDNCIPPCIQFGYFACSRPPAPRSPPARLFPLKAVAHLDGKHVVFGEVQSGIKVLDRMKSVTLVEPKKDGKPAPDQRVGSFMIVS